MVLSGRDKGKQGRVARVLRDGRLIVSGIHRVKRHVKPNPDLGRSGGIIEQEAPIQASNVGLLDSESGKPSRVGFKIMKDGSKLRVFRPSGREIPSAK